MQLVSVFSQYLSLTELSYSVNCNFNYLTWKQLQSFIYLFFPLIPLINECARGTNLTVVFSAAEHSVVVIMNSRNCKVSNGDFASLKNTRRMNRKKTTYCLDRKICISSRCHKMVSDHNSIKLVQCTASRLPCAVMLIK